MSDAKVTNMRDQMPRTAKRVDAMRARFGADKVNAHIKAGMAGEPGRFYSSEGGKSVGTPTPAFLSFADLAAEMLPGVVMTRIQCADDISLRRPAMRAASASDVAQQAAATQTPRLV